MKKWFCDRKGCGREIPVGEHQVVEIDGLLYDIYKENCLAPFADMKREVDRLGKEYADAFARDVATLKTQFIEGTGREAKT